MIGKPALVTTPRTRDWWAAAARGELLLQSCTTCGHLQHYPRIVCAKCWSESLEWVPAAGQGTIWTFTVVHRPGHPGWEADAPYVIALVELDEGPRLMTNIVGCPAESVHVGQRVTTTTAVPADGSPVLIVFEPA